MPIDTTRWHRFGQSGCRGGRGCRPNRPGHFGGRKAAAASPGQQITLKNVGTAATANLVATLQATGGVTNPGSPQTFGAIAPGIALVSLVIGLNLCADGLREFADPTRRGRA